MKRVGPALLLAVCVALLLPAPALAARDKHVTHGLDFLHARQRATGGFSNSSANANPYATPWTILAISAGSEWPTQWKDSGKNPVQYLQSLDLESVALASQPFNPPAYYARCILAYKAAGRPDLVFNAGTKHLDLVAKMNAYNGPVDGDGHYSPQTSGSRNLYSISTTSWAILGLAAAGETGGEMNKATTWLNNASRLGPHDGFATQPGEQENVDDSAAGILALRAAGIGSGSGVIPELTDYLALCQKDSNAGFRYTDDGTYAYSESTSWAIQALRATGKITRVGDAWVVDAQFKKGDATPFTFLRARQLKSGAFEHRDGVVSDALMSTSVSVIGVAGDYLPVIRASDPFTPKWRPYFKSFKPSGGTTFHTRTVTVSATYADNSGGTGINAGAVRVHVDGANKTGPASVGSSKLTLRLTNLANGSHTVTIKLVDRAGNEKSAAHSFKVSVSSGGGGGSGGGGSTPTTPPTTTPTYKPPTTLTPTTTATPTTIWPTSPYPSTYPSTSGYPYTASPYSSGYPYFSPSPSPSASGSPTPGATDNGGSSWGAVALALVLVSLVPLGAFASWVVRKRMFIRLLTATRGKILPGGGSGWQRLKGRFGGHGGGSATTDENVT